MTREEAIKNIKEWDFINKDDMEVLSTLIPELVESEDERIRKALLIDGVRQIRCKNGITQEQMIAYLEKQKEQTAVDLDKFTEKIDNYKARYKFPVSISINGAMAFMARMFYQYPNVARDWYENLPKATMDDNARKKESK